MIRSSVNVNGLIVAIGVIVSMATTEVHATPLPMAIGAVGAASRFDSGGRPALVPIAQRDRCGHRAPCGGRKRYPLEQLTAPGWCDSHFVIDGMGRRVHRCPRPWTREEIERHRAGRR
jgi:hypothetical protein